MTGAGNIKIGNINLDPVNVSDTTVIGYVKKWLGQDSVCRDVGSILGSDTAIVGGGKALSNGCEAFSLAISDASTWLPAIFCALTSWGYQLATGILNSAMELLSFFLGNGATCNASP
jgi:hypothetical protein